MSPVALWPTNRRHAIFDVFATWVLASIVLMFIVASDMRAPHHVAVLQAAR